MYFSNPDAELELISGQLKQIDNYQKNFFIEKNKLNNELEKAEKRLPGLKGSKYDLCLKKIQEIKLELSDIQLKIESFQKKYPIAMLNDLRQKEHTLREIQKSRYLEEQLNIKKKDEQRKLKAHVERYGDVNDFNNIHKISLKLASECAEKWKNLLNSDVEPQQIFDGIIEVECVYRTGKEYLLNNYSDNYLQRAGLIILKAGYLVGQNEDLDLAQKVTYLQIACEKFNALLNEAQCITELRTDFTPCYSSQISLTEIPEESYTHWSKMCDDNVSDHQLYDFYVKTLEQIYAEELIDHNEYRKLEKITQRDFARECEQWEKIVDFDFDEACNTVINSINTLRYYKSKKIEMSPLISQHIFSSFLLKTSHFDESYILKKHKFYTFLNEECKAELLSLMKNVINLNNSVEGLNIKISLSLLARRETLFNLKSRLFQLAYKITKNIFFGIYLPPKLPRDKENMTRAFNRLNIEFTKALDSYIAETFSRFNQPSVIIGILNLFFKSIKWHQLNFGILGGIPLVQAESNYKLIPDKLDFSLSFLRVRDVILSYPNAKHALLNIAPYEKFDYKDQTDSFLGTKEVLNEILNSQYLDSYKINHSKLFLADSYYNTLNDYQRHIQILAEDMREMCRLLVKNYKAKDSILPLDFTLYLDKHEFTGLYALWQWETINDSLGRICIGGRGYEDMVEQSEKKSRIDASYLLILRVNWDGSISSVETPWLNTFNYDRVIHSHIHDFTLYLLSIFHNRFIEQYAQTAEKLKKEINHEVSLEIHENTSNDEVYYDRQDLEILVLNHTLDQFKENNYVQLLEHDDPVSQVMEQPFKKIKTYFNSTIKSTHFFKLLEKYFDVKITEGKGSEINVSRVAHEGRVYRLGHHGKMVEYNAVYVRNVLKRLNISLDEWLKVI